jgi:hypothetical protein
MDPLRHFPQRVSLYQRAGGPRSNCRIADHWSPDSADHTIKEDAPLTPVAGVFLCYGSWWGSFLGQSATFWEQYSSLRSPFDQIAYGLFNGRPSDGSTRTYVPEVGKGVALGTPYSRYSVLKRPSPVPATRVCIQGGNTLVLKVGGVAVKFLRSTQVPCNLMAITVCWMLYRRES